MPSAKAFHQPLQATSVGLQGVLRLTVLAASLLGLSACAVMQPPATPGAAPMTAVVPSATAKTTSPAASQPAAPVQAPVAAATQRDFDNALALMRAGRWDEADKALSTLAQAEPKLSGVHANWGIVHRQAGRLKEAVAALEQAVSLNPQQPTTYNQLGITHRQAGNFAKAKAAYEQALALDANHAAATLNLGILHDLYLGDVPRAAELYAKYLTLTPSGDPAVTKWVAELKNRKGTTNVAARQEKP